MSGVQFVQMHPNLTAHVHMDLICMYKCLHVLPEAACEFLQIHPSHPALEKMGASSNVYNKKADEKGDILASLLGIFNVLWLFELLTIFLT